MPFMGELERTKFEIRETNPGTTFTGSDTAPEPWLLTARILTAYEVPSVRLGIVIGDDVSAGDKDCQVEPLLVLYS